MQAEFEKTLPFDLSTGPSGDPPGNAGLALGNTTKPFYLTQTEVDARTARCRCSNSASPSPTATRRTSECSQAEPRRRHPALPAQRRRGADRATTEWTRGERYGVGKATLLPRDARPGHGDQARATRQGLVHRRRRDQRLVHLPGRVSRHAAPRAGPVGRGLHRRLAGAGTPGRSYLSYYVDALAANGIAYDVYDVDANGRTAPDALGVLRHYDAVVWYTGDDVITREPGWGPATRHASPCTRLLPVRDYLNEGGQLLYTGKYAGTSTRTGTARSCTTRSRTTQCSRPGDQPRCRPLGGSGDALNDFLEYWFGAGLVNDDAGADPAADNPFDVVGTDTPFAGLSWGFNGTDSAANQDHSASFIATSALLPADQYPQFASWPAAKYDRPGGPFDPHTGSFYMYSQISDVSYKRLTRTINVPAGGADMSFWTSYDTEPDWDYVFVEAHTVGRTTGRRCPTRTATPARPPARAARRAGGPAPAARPLPDLNADVTCSPTGTTGTWNAATGNSAGWQQWEVDLSAYAGKQVEVSIAYVSDWATQGLGMFVDDIEVSTGEGSTSFEPASTDGR